MRGPGAVPVHRYPKRRLQSNVCTSALGNIVWAEIKATRVHSRRRRVLMGTAHCVDAVRDAIRVCHQWLEATVADVSSEQAHWRPVGIANPIAAVYAHVVVGADVAVNVLLKGEQPIITARTHGAGISEMMPTSDWHDWALRVRLDLATFREYAGQVYASWYDYLGELTEDAMARPVDLSVWGMGQRTLDQFMLIQVEHVSCHIGEIACLKGMQGAVGFRPGTADGIG